MTLPAHVLIVDDSEDDRDLYERLLRKELRIESIDLAECGEEALAFYRQRPADCVVLDFNLPDCNGLRVLEQLKALDPCVAVVMMTGEGNEDIAVAAMKAGAFDYMVKDAISAPILRRALSNTADRGSLVRRLAAQRQEQTDFIRVLVHDIRAPLRGLISFADILAEDLEAGVHDDVPEHLELIRLSAMRLNALIDTLAHYALLDRDIAFEPVDTKAIVSQVLDHLHLVIEERHAKVEIGVLPQVTGHGPQLVQLFQNLIGNGIKYNQQPVPTVSVSAESAGEAWRFAIEDNGIGIPGDKQNMVFEPFQRLWSQDAYEGSGLGLAICRKIVERHGGRIWCESEPGQGSRFCFTMPPG